MLQAVPIRCLNPQPRMVKNRSQQNFILEIPNAHISKAKKKYVHNIKNDEL